MIEREDVRAELHASDVLQTYGAKFRKRGSEYRMATCPRCNETSPRQPVAISSRDGQWIHHGRERGIGGTCSGDVFDLVAAFEGVDPKRDFPKVLERAAKIAGVDARIMTDIERATRRVLRERRAADRDRQDAIEDAKMLVESKIKASMAWSRLRGLTRQGPRPWTPAGDAYIRSRGLDPRRLIEEDYMRCSAVGDLCVGLYSYQGDLVNVARRVIAPAEGEARMLVESDCPIVGSMVGRVQEITSADTIVTEGIVDTLTAVQLWPKGLALGAHCAGQLPALVAAAAVRVKACGGRLLIVPDGDDVGQRAAARAVDVAVDAGLVADQTLIIVDLGEHGDLNAAHVAGWRVP